ncbi:MAG: outer rane lipoproteinsorting protein [Flavipsychrobacter sp.]|nr:outer rane lipoproteinsorting protein [Flavipsychrobacter sp.]
MNTIRCTLTSAFFLLAGITCQVKAQTADEIIKKHVEAMGGADKWKNIKSVKISGSFITEGEAAKVLFNYTIADHKGIRKEYTYAASSDATAYVVITPTEGWSLIPQIGFKVRPEALPPVTVRKFHFFLDAQDPLINHKAKGNVVTYIGKEMKQGSKCYKMQITNAADKDFTEFMYLDTSTYFNKVTAMASEGHGEIDLIFWSDYKQLPEGIMYPMTFNEGAGPQYLDKVELNAPIDKNTFHL